MQANNQQIYLGHLETITSHKLEVMKLMYRCGLGFQGLFHDNSKYLPIEFVQGLIYYQKTRSPNAAERESKGYSEAWLHHKGRNRHHFEYWIEIVGPKTKLPDFAQSFEMGNGAQIVAAPMPTRYIVEMFCDRVAASKIYQGNSYTNSSALDYFNNELAVVKGMMHEDTLAFIYCLLLMLSEQGEETTIQFIREHIVRPHYCYTPFAPF